MVVEKTRVKGKGVGKFKLANSGGGEHLVGWVM